MPFKLIKYIVLKLIRLIEKVEYIGVNFDESNDDIKIIDTQFLERYQIKTDTGFHPLTNVHLTQPYTQYNLKTDNGKYLECADNHIVFNEEMNQIFVKDLEIGDYIQTDNGISRVSELSKSNHKICMSDVTVASIDHRFYSNGILSHNTVTSAIFMLWYLLFHPEKTALCVADNFSTTKELIDKFKISLEGLPFFMKPGIESINSSNVKFDSKSRIVGRTTTKKSGIGLSVNLLYVDEFAHINEANIDEFYRAIFPTVTADPNGKIIITSTPNGKNKFWEIWKDAVNKESNFVPLRVDWWQVPGRDEQWKKDKIADLGSVEDFNQEYGLQFFASDKLLLNSRDLKRLDIIKQEYVQTSIQFSEELSYIGESLFFHKKYKNWNISDFKSDPTNYVFSIDTADGIGGDYSILNIFKVVPLPLKELLKKKHLIKDETDTISLVQIGYLRSNQIDINEFTLACEHIIYDIFNPDQTRIVIELNHKGDIILNRLSDNDNYWSGQIIATKHTQASEKYKPGLKLGPTNKLKYCEKFKYMITINRIIPNDELTIDELSSFGRSKGGIYRGQNGNDDLAMTSVNISSVFDSSQFWDIAVETYERSDKEYQKQVVDKIFNLNSSETKSVWDFDELRKMNGSQYNGQRKNYSKNDVFNTDTLNHLKNLRNNFFNNK